MARRKGKRGHRHKYRVVQFLDKVRIECAWKWGCGDVMAEWTVVPAQPVSLRFPINPAA